MIIETAQNVDDQRIINGFVPTLYKLIMKDIIYTDDAINSIYG